MFTKLVTCATVLAYSNAIKVKVEGVDDDIVDFNLLEWTLDGLTPERTADLIDELDPQNFIGFREVFEHCSDHHLEGKICDELGGDVTTYAFNVAEMDQYKDMYLTERKKIRNRERKYLRWASKGRDIDRS